MIINLVVKAITFCRLKSYVAINTNIFQQNDFKTIIFLSYIKD